MPDTTDPQPFPIWVVWREEEPAYGYFATEQAAKTATIDCWEEEEPSCPDYGWGPDGPRWELLAGGEAAGVFVSRHLVYGAPASAPPAPADRSGLRDRIADTVVPLLLDTLPKVIARARGYEIADAVMSVLPPAADRAAVLREAADAITAVIERDRAYSPRRSNDRAALGGAREIVLGLIDQPGRVADEEQQAETQAALPCTASVLRKPHGPHGWEPQPDMDLVRCPGYTPPAVVAEPGKETGSAAVFLSSRCDACQHTLNWHRNDVGCTVALCVCGRFQPPAEESTP